jgi:outer membrane murein-binding lipoprotein Lpp
MRIVFSTLVIVFIAGLLLVGCGAPAELQGQLAQLQTENSQLKASNDQLQTEKDQLVEKVTELTEDTLKDPTYANAVAFIKGDNTDKEITRDHALAVITVIENAQKQGIRSYWVVAQTPGVYGGVGFNFIGFNTTDRGWVYFCTTNICADTEVKIEIGKKLHISNPTWSDPGFDDTVISIHHLPL